MANVIEIVIKATDQKATETMAAARRQVETLDQSFSAAIPTMALFAYGVGQVARAAISMTRAAADQVEQLDNLHATTSESVRTLQVYGNELQKAGLSAQQLPAALTAMQLSLERNQEQLALYGITARDNVTDALKQLGRALETVNVPSERAELIAAALGSRNVKLAATLIGTAESMDQLTRAASEDGSLLSDNSLDRLRAADGAFDRMDQSIASLKNNAAVAFVPLIEAMEKVVSLAADFARYRASWDASANASLGVAAAGLTGGFRGFGGGDSNGRGGGADWGDPDALGGASSPFDQGGWIRRFRERAKAAKGLRPRVGGEGTDNTDTLFGAFIRSEGAFGSSTRQPGRATPFEAMVKTLREVEEPIAKLTEGGKLLAAALDESARIANAFTSELQGNWGNTLARLTQIQTQTNNVIVQLLVDLGNAIIGTITDTIARVAGGAVGNFLSSAIGFALAPVTGGTSLIGSGGLVPAGPRAGQGGFGSLGGNTYVIQTFDARSTLQQVVSPSGTFRRANDRVLELRRA